MTCLLCRATISSTSRSKREGVYIAATPLRAPRGPPQLLMSTIASLKVFGLQHFMVIINASSPPDSGPLVFDFQPQDPEDLYTAIAALSGRKVPGVILQRRLKRLPQRNCWFVGYSQMDDAVIAVQKFNGKWDTDLRIGHHDCRNYAGALVEYLTGKRFVLDNLQSGR